MILKNARVAIDVILARQHLLRTAGTALVVGSWLTAFNQWSVIWDGLWTPMLILKITLNYLTPFVVANIGLLSRHASADATK